MKKYLRLLRIQDQYIQMSSALFAGIFAHLRSWDILIWSIAVTFLSCATFIVNEWTDRKDSDRYSWNPVHKHAQDILHPWIIGGLFLVTSLVGLWLALMVGLLWWGSMLWIIGVLYSLEPIRFKRRFLLDIVAQLLVWWVLPFWAPVWKNVPIELALAMIIVMSFIIWSVFYPYQIADFEADRKADLQNTHVILGVRTSTEVGFILGIVGLVLFFLFGFQRLWGPLFPLLVIQGIALWAYGKWLTYTNIKQMLTGMQMYVRVLKPVGILFPFYWFLWWRFLT